MVPALAVMLCGCSQEDAAKGYISTKNCPDTEPDKAAKENAQTIKSNQYPSGENRAVFCINSVFPPIIKT